MIGFVVLFALFIWVIVTIFSMMLFHKICRKIFPNYRWSGIVGVFIGFMLLMGGWFVYWGIEYIQVRSYLSEMCKQSGIKIYITPEEWKEKIGGEEAWRNIRIIDKSPPDNIKDETIVFEGDKYSISWQYNELVYSYKIRGCTRLALNSTPLPQDFKLPGWCAEVKSEFAFFQEQRERFAIDSVVLA